MSFIATGIIDKPPAGVLPIWIGGNDFLLVGVVAAGKNLIMNLNLTSASIPYLLFYTFGILAAIFVILMVYTGRREGHLI